MLDIAQPGDETRLEDFLSGHTETSMFLRSNLAAHGIGSDEPLGTTFYVWQTDRQIRAVFGKSNSGYLLCQNPEKAEKPALEFAAKVRKKPLLGMTGCATQVPLVIAGLGYPQSAWKIAGDEPLFSLDLNQLQPTVDVDNLRPACPDDLQFLPDWFRGNDIDTGFSTAGPAVDKRAKELAKKAIHRPSFCILEENGIPVAMSDLNAKLPDIVQIGGVYVPPYLRNKGYARRVVAAQLARAKKNGVQRAILFAISEPAARAYRAIGFQHIGQYRINLVDPDWTPE